MPAMKDIGGSPFSGGTIATQVNGVTNGESMQMVGGEEANGTIFHFVKEAIARARRRTTMNWNSLNCLTQLTRRTGDSSPLGRMVTLQQLRKMEVLSISGRALLLTSIIYTGTSW